MPTVSCNKNVYSRFFWKGRLEVRDGSETQRHRRELHPRCLYEILNPEHNFSWFYQQKNKNPLSFFWYVSTLDDGDFTQNKSKWIELIRIHVDVANEVTLLLQYFQNWTNDFRLFDSMNECTFLIILWHRCDFLHNINVYSGQHNSFGLILNEVTIIKCGNVAKKR